jgi:hypothetical protein
MESNAAYERFLKRNPKHMKTEPETGEAATAAQGKMPKVEVGEAGHKQPAMSVPLHQERGSLVQMAIEHVATAGPSFPLRIGRGRPGARASHSVAQPVAPVQPVGMGTAILPPITPVYDSDHAEARKTALLELIEQNPEVICLRTQPSKDFSKAMGCSMIEVFNVNNLRHLVFEMVTANENGIWPQDSPFGYTWAVYCVLRQKGFKEPEGEPRFSLTPTNDMLWFKRYVFSHNGASTWAKYPDMD